MGTWTPGPNATDGDDLFVASPGGEVFVDGLGGNDTLNGADGVDVMFGGAGRDSLLGGGGDDVLRGGDTQAHDVENDTLSGGDGNDDLYGYGGIDSLLGGDGNDVLHVIDAGGLAHGGAGQDHLIVHMFEGVHGYQVDISLPDSWLKRDGVNLLRVISVERLFMQGGGGDDVITGGALDDSVAGMDGNDLLVGNGGRDQLEGGLGADTLLGGDGEDWLIDSGGVGFVDGGAGDDFIGDDFYPSSGAIFRGEIDGGEGNDEALLYFGDVGNVDVRWSQEGVVTIVLSGGGDLLLTARNIEAFEFQLSAAGGTFLGTEGNDTLPGSWSDDLVLGYAGNDSLSGGLGNDTLNGGDGADTMKGGFGNDVFYVNHGGDVVTEGWDAGIDAVRTSITYELGANVEGLTIIGSGARNGTGNDLNNTLTGNDAANKLRGLFGEDTINAGAGNDTLDGGLGIDFLRGEAGDDTYDVDNVDDFVRELANGGVDTVRTSTTRALDPNAENLVITGGAARNGSGNSQDNQLTGNAAANILAGRLGADTIFGGGGNDKLNGGEGLDALTGGPGQDAFVFDVAAIAANADAITDFSVADDTIHLDNAIFTQLGGAGALNASMFRIGSSPADANDFLYYNPTSGALYYDANANAAGGAFRIATLAPGLALTAADFLVI